MLFPALDTKKDKYFLNKGKWKENYVAYSHSGGTDGSVAFSGAGRGTASTRARDDA